MYQALRGHSALAELLVLLAVRIESGHQQSVVQIGMSGCSKSSFAAPLHVTVSC